MSAFLKGALKSLSQRTPQSDVRAELNKLINNEHAEFKFVIMIDFIVIVFLLFLLFKNKSEIL